MPRVVSSTTVAGSPQLLRYLHVAVTKSVLTPSSACTTHGCSPQQDELSESIVLVAAECSVDVSVCFCLYMHAHVMDMCTCKCIWRGHVVSCSKSEVVVCGMCVCVMPSQAVNQERYMYTQLCVVQLYAVCCMSMLYVDCCC